MHGLKLICMGREKPALPHSHKCEWVLCGGGWCVGGESMGLGCFARAGQRLPAFPHSHKREWVLCWGVWGSSCMGLGCYAFTGESLPFFTATSVSGLAAHGLQNALSADERFILSFYAMPQVMPTSLQLHYRAPRPGLSNVVVGLVEAVAREVYGGWINFQPLPRQLPSWEDQLTCLDHAEVGAKFKDSKGNRGLGARCMGGRVRRLWGYRGQGQHAYVGPRSTGRKVRGRRRGKGTKGR